MTAMTRLGSSTADKQKNVEDSLVEIREALLAIRYGAIAITVHEDRVVQIDVTEKKRLRPS